MKTREWKSELWLPASPDQLFDFFGDAANLDALTPKWLNFKILTPTPTPASEGPLGLPDADFPPLSPRERDRVRAPSPLFKVSEGSLIDYQLRVRGFPIRWRTRINVWDPPHRFVDKQIRGPYRLWVHEHTFTPERGGTLVKDYVRYAVPFDWLVHAWLVRPDIERIFAFRAEKLQEKFGLQNSH